MAMKKYIHLEVDLKDKNRAPLSVYGEQGWQLVAVDNGVAYFIQEKT